MYKMRKLIIVLFAFIVLSLSTYGAMTEVASDNFECNGFSCGTGWTGSWTPTTGFEITTLSGPIGTYQMRSTTTGNTTKSLDLTSKSEINISFYVTATSLEAGDFCRYYYNNGTALIELTNLTTGQDTGTLTYRSFNVTRYGGSTNSGLMVRAQTGATGDYCYIDNISIKAETLTVLNLFTNTQYLKGDTNVIIQMSSSLANTQHTLELRDASTNLFCSKTLTSPSAPYTMFSTTCDMPNTTQTGATAKLYVTAEPTKSVTKNFDVVDMQQNTSSLNIKKVYYSPQVLQGGTTDIYALIESSNNISSIVLTVTFPDTTQREFYMEPTRNINEYKATISDTYQVGNTLFTIRALSGTYYSQYSSQYNVAAYSVDFVNTVAKCLAVDNVTTVENVKNVNDPEMEVFGTEYIEGDDATIFLLLKDGTGTPVETGTCSVDIYYPNFQNLTHPEWVDDAVMMYLEEGLYYYDFTVPYYAGLYMVNAKCAYSTNNNYFYTLASGKAPTRNVTTGTYTGDPFVLNDFSEWLYTQCGSGGGGTKICDAWYQWNVSGFDNITRLDVQYLGEASAAATLTMYWWNWSSSTWISLPNTLVFKSTAAGGVPSGIDEYVTNNVPLAAISNGSLVRIRTATTLGTNFNLFDNWLTLRSTAIDTTIQELKGSGEVHVSGLPPGGNRYVRVTSCDGYWDGRCGFFTNDGEFDLLEGEVEEYFNFTALTTRSETQVLYESAYTLDCTALYWIKIWNGTDWEIFNGMDDIYSDVSNENCLISMHLDTIAGQNYQMWFKFDNYMKWEIDWSKNILDALSSEIQTLCADRNFTYEVPITDTTTLSNDSLTHFCHQAYDDMYWIDYYYNWSQTVNVAGEYASFVQEMRFYRNNLDARLIYLQLGNTTPQMAEYYAKKNWEYNNRNLTYYPTQSDMTNYTRISSDVWNNSVRNLTYYPTTTVNTTEIAQGVWNFTGTPNATLLTNIATAIWNFVGRYVHGILYS